MEPLPDDEQVTQKPKCHFLRSCCLPFFDTQTDFIDLTYAVTSNVISVPTLFIIRLLSFLYAATVYISGYITDALATSQDSYRFNVYFTHVSYLGLCLYFLSSIIFTGYYLLNRKGGKSIPTLSPAIRFIFWLQYELTITFHVVVPLVYWLFLRANWQDMSIFSRWNDVSFHGLDFALIFIEFCISRMFIFWTHVGYMILIVALYAIMTWVNFAITNTWVYFFLDWSTPYAAIWYVGLFAFFIIVYTVVWKIHHFRDYLIRRCIAPQAIESSPLEEKDDPEMVA